MFGYNGKVLRVNLKERTIKIEALNLEEAKKFIGGRGLGTKMLMDEIDPMVDPLSPENKLIIITGPLTGTPVPTGGRYMVVTKSPLSGTIACSNSGGYWGAEFKAAGYDAIIFEDKADVPVYLTIIDEKVEIKDAGSLWGKLVTETTDIIKKEMPDKSRVLTIGPAGERLSKMAAIMNDYDRAAGLPTYGTAVLVNILNESGLHPTNNFCRINYCSWNGALLNYLRLLETVGKKSKLLNCLKA